MGSASADDEEVATARAGSEVEARLYHLTTRHGPLAAPGLFAHRVLR